MFSVLPGAAQPLGTAHVLPGALRPTRPAWIESVFVIEPVKLTLPAHGVAEAGGAGVAVCVGPLTVGVGLGFPVQLGNLNDPIRVRHVRSPVTCMYSVVYQNVQSSTGSTVISL